MSAGRVGEPPPGGGLRRYVSRSPSRVRSGTYVVIVSDSPAMSGASPPVPRTVTGPASSSSRMPPHQPVDLPREAVEPPTAGTPPCSCRSPSAARRARPCGARAARIASASMEISMPGASAPPKNSPRRETTSMLVDVPKSTTTQAVLEERVGGEGVHHAVGADLVGVVDQQRDAGPHTRADHDGRQVGGGRAAAAARAGGWAPWTARAIRVTSGANGGRAWPGRRTSSSSAVIRGSVRMRQSRIKRWTCDGDRVVSA